MKFKVVAGSKVFKALQELYMELQAHEKTIKAFLEEVGAREYAFQAHYLCGAITWLYFGDKEPLEPWQWKKHKTEDGYYFPLRTRKNKQLLDRIAALPSTTNTPLNNLLGIKPQLTVQGGLMVLFHRPAVAWAKDYVLFSVPDDFAYTPPVGVKEILVTEYNRLEAAIKPGWYQPGKSSK